LIHVTDVSNKEDRCLVDCHHRLQFLQSSSITPNMRASIHRIVLINIVIIVSQLLLIWSAAAVNLKRQRILIPILWK